MTNTERPSGVYPRIKVGLTLSMSIIH
jgi:hypothetical protein